VNSFEVNYGMGQIILERAHLNPANTALTFNEQSTDYAAFAERIRRVASVLRDKGISRGDRVGLISHNHPSFLEVLYACSCLGAIFVPLNFRLASAEVAFIAKDAGVKVIFADDNCLPLIEAEREQLACTDFIATQNAPDNWQAYDGLVENAEPLQTVEHMQADDVALIMYTSGTTGLPKGAMLTHGNVFWNALNVAFMGLRMRGATLTCAPLFHIGGLNVTTHISLSFGVEVVLHESFDAGAVLADIERYKVSTMFGAPTMFLMMAQHENFAAADLSSIISFNVGSAPVPLSLLEVYQARGIEMEQGYGLTETAPYVSVLAAEFAMTKLGSAGNGLTFTSVRIVDDTNQPVGAGVQGEICIKGPNVMRGYWNRPDATEAAIDKEGWFHSGDIGYLDEDGFLFICDRLKDMVISGGENIFPVEVESAILSHEAVGEVAVIGIPDEKWGEAVHAIIVLKDGMKVSGDDILEHCRTHIASYKMPRGFTFRAEPLPLSGSNKVLKRELRAPFWESPSK
jgi:fatty-acyl-CoA synthase